MRRWLLILVCAFLVPVLSAAPPGAQDAQPSDPLHKPLDEILDVNVRDGFVYYRALKSMRGRLDRYVASLNVPSPTYDGWGREQQMAFWLNAYNAFVLQTVVNAYPIGTRYKEFPPGSIRQVPGAFDRTAHRAAGRSVTLDAIEKEILPAFKEPRLYLALGRGAVGSGRLRSEAYAAARLSAQLDAVRREFVAHQPMLRIDRTTGEMSVTPIISWREAEFVAAYDTDPSGPFAQRSPVERAIVAFVMPNLLPLERDFVQKNAFKVTYHPFDWRLNDLTGGRN